MDNFVKLSSTRRWWPLWDLQLGPESLCEWIKMGPLPHHIFPSLFSSTQVVKKRVAPRFENGVVDDTKLGKKETELWTSFPVMTQDSALKSGKNSKLFIQTWSSKNSLRGLRKIPYSHSWNLMVMPDSRPGEEVQTQFSWRKIFRSFFSRSLYFI